MKFLTLILCLLFLTGLAVAASQPASTPAPSTPALSAAPDRTVDDDFSPGLLFFALIAMTVMLVLAGIGIAIGLAVAGATALLVGIGILSTSAAIGFLKRRPGAAVRALLFQGAALAGIPCGIAAFWIVRQLAHVHLAIAEWVIWGSLCGAASGLLVALTLNFTWGRLYLKLTEKVRAR